MLAKQTSIHQRLMMHCTTVSYKAVLELEEAYLSHRRLHRCQRLHPFMMLSTKTGWQSVFASAREVDCRLTRMHGVYLQVHTSCMLPSDQMQMASFFKYIAEAIIHGCSQSCSQLSSSERSDCQTLVKDAESICPRQNGSDSLARSVSPLQALESLFHNPQNLTHVWKQMIVKVALYMTC